MLSEPRRGAAHLKRSHVNCLMKYKEADGDIWEAQSKGAKVRSSQQQGRPRDGGEKAKVTSGEGAAKAGVLSQYGRQVGTGKAQLPWARNLGG